MYCETYKCQMSKYACYARRNNALSSGRSLSSRPGYSDPVCQTCEMGARIALEINPKKAREYSSELRRIRENAIESLPGKERARIKYSQNSGFEPRQKESAPAPPPETVITEDPPEKTAAPETKNPKPEQKRLGRPPKQKSENPSKSFHDPFMLEYLELQLKHCQEKVDFYKRAIALMTKP
jgi:hypothetical protein